VVGGETQEAAENDPFSNMSDDEVVATQDRLHGEGHGGNLLEFIKYFICTPPPPLPRLLLWRGCSALVPTTDQITNRLQS
jgi:hypothetical protein